VHTGADVVDGADVATVEADAWTDAEHALPGRVEGLVEGEGVGGAFFGVALGALLEGERGRAFAGAGVVGEGLGCLGLADEVFSCERTPCYLSLPVVMHPAKAKFRPETHTAPDTVLGGDQVGQPLADLRQANEVPYIQDRHVPQDMHQDLIRKPCDRARRRRHPLHRRSSRLDRQPRETPNKILHALRRLYRLRNNFLARTLPASSRLRRRPRKVLILVLLVDAIIHLNQPSVKHTSTTTR
jgi:hypothetical protein